MTSVLDALERIVYSQVRLRKHPGHDDQGVHGNWAEGPAAPASPTSAERLATIDPAIMSQVSPETLRHLADVDSTGPQLEDLPEAEPRVPEPLMQQAEELAQPILEEAQETVELVHEPVLGVIADLGGQPHGLEFEVKTEGSLARKLADGLARGMTPEQASADQKDTVRYTGVFPEGEFSESATSFIEAMTAAGFTPLKSKVTFGSRAAADTGGLREGEFIPGMAVNTAWEAPNGGAFEVQLHTPDSLVAKTYSHPYYAVARVMPEDEPLARDLAEKMSDLASLVDVPPGIDSVPQYRYVP